jgi:hypothetical protein
MPKIQQTRPRRYQYRIVWEKTNDKSVWLDCDGYYHLDQLIKDPFILTLEYKTVPDSPEVQRYYDRLNKGE